MAVALFGAIRISLGWIGIVLSQHAINLLKLPPYLFLGQMTLDTFKGSLALAPFVPVGVVLGYWLNSLVSEALFTRIIFVALSLTGLKLVYDGLTALV